MSQYISFKKTLLSKLNKAKDLVCGKYAISERDNVQNWTGKSDWTINLIFHQDMAPVVICVSTDSNSDSLSMISKEQA